jgi:hypothetical protein
VTILPRDRLEQVGLLAIGLVLLATAWIGLPRVLSGSRAPVVAATPLPPPAPPAAVLLQDELDRDLQGIFILVVEASTVTRIGTAFAVNAQGDLLTSADLVRGATAMRLIDNSGGNHTVGLVGVDESLDLADVRVPTGALALPLGDPNGLHVNDPLVVLAPPKNAMLASNAPATITQIDARGGGVIPDAVALLKLSADIHPANSGGPVVGAGGKVVGITVLVGDSETLAGFALPVTAAAADLTRWSQPASAPLPLAALPAGLVLRGTDVTTPAHASGATLVSAQPGRASAGVATTITLHGSGFVAGSALQVRFSPTAGGAGAFTGAKLTLADSASITITVPAGEAVQDYTIALTNGDGSAATNTLSFTIVP